MLIKTALDVFWETPMPPLRDLESPLPDERPQPPAEPKSNPIQNQKPRAATRTLRREKNRAYLEQAGEMQEHLS
jgi:hypothetical protein